MAIYSVFFFSILAHSVMVATSVAAGGGDGSGSGDGGVGVVAVVVTVMVAVCRGLHLPTEDKHLEKAIKRK